MGCSSIPCPLRPIVYTAGVLGAEPLSDPATLRALRDQARAIQEGATGQDPAQWLRVNPHIEAADRAARRLVERVRGKPQVQSPSGSAGQGVTIFATRALGEVQLREIFAAASVVPGTRILFRGVAVGESLTDFLRSIAPLLEGLDPAPSVAIDPRPFREAQVSVAPVMLVGDGVGEGARVAGLSDPAWLLRALAQGRSGDLGARGPVVAISERDLIAEMQRRAAALDLDELRERAIARYWQGAALEPLPPATEVRVREIDPTISAEHDLVLPDGKVLARAGDRINPLDRMPFRQRLVVFDATDPAQVQTAQDLGAKTGVARVIYLASNLERTAGWEAFNDVQSQLGAPLYLLTA
ncbi:MAG: TrbC family F-type conjugative pilus assembly protein, partial [Anaerolineae bacterium]